MPSPTPLRRSSRLRTAPKFYSPPPPPPRKLTGNNKNVAHRERKQWRRRRQLHGGQPQVEQQSAAAAASETGAANIETQNSRNRETSMSVSRGRKRRAVRDDIQAISSSVAAAHEDDNHKPLKRRIVETTTGATHGLEEISPSSEGERRALHSSHQTSAQSDQTRALSLPSSAPRPFRGPVDAFLRGNDYDAFQILDSFSQQRPFQNNQDQEEVSITGPIFPSIEVPLATQTPANSLNPVPQRLQYQGSGESRDNVSDTGIESSTSMPQETLTVEIHETPQPISLLHEQRQEPKYRASSRYSPDNVLLPPRGIDIAALHAVSSQPSVRSNGNQENIPPVSEMSTIIESEVTLEWQRHRPRSGESESRQSDLAENREPPHLPARQSGGSNVENVKILEERLYSHQSQLQNIREKVEKIAAQPQELEELKSQVAGVVALANLSHTAAQKHTNELSDLKQRISVLEKSLSKQPEIDTRIMIRLKELQATNVQDARFTALEKEFYDHFGINYKHLGNATNMPPEVSGAWYLRAQAHLRCDQDTRAQHDADEEIIRDAEVITSTWLASGTSYVTGDQAQAFAKLFAKACEREAMRFPSDPSKPANQRRRPTLAASAIE